MSNVVNFKARDQAMRDSYTNFAASVGLGTNNLASYGGYTFNFLTNNRIELEALYRGSWIIGAAVDMQADDMTQAGIEIQSTMPPAKVEETMEYLEKVQLWQTLNSSIKWSRLYGSAVGIYLIDGQDMSTPLNIDTVGRDQFKGILPMDRWQLIPSIGNLVKDFGPFMGQPKYYDTVADAILPNLGRIHYTRLFRLDTIELPHYQKLTANLWAESIVERIFDRLLAFDSTTQGAAQLVFKAYLRTWKIENLRELIAAGGPALTALMQNIAMIRQIQTSEGITIMDSKDEFDTHQYTFAGLDDVLMQFGQQLAGALEIPLVRLFGTSPKGMNATGESDLRTYYDGIKRKQKTKLRAPVKTVLELTYRSLYGAPLPKGTSFEFNPLWQMTDAEKSEMASKDTTAITSAFTAGLVPRDIALKELRQSSKTNGMWSNVDDETIKDAESEPPLSDFIQTPEEEAALNESSGEGGGKGGGE